MPVQKDWHYFFVYYLLDERELDPDELEPDELEPDELDDPLDEELSTEEERAGGVYDSLLPLLVDSEVLDGVLGLTLLSVVVERDERSVVVGRVFLSVFGVTDRP